MEIISERERILLGYAPRDPFTGVVLISQRRNSDVDFHDVFGGPPRRSPIYESRRTRADSIDLNSRGNRGREDSVESQRSRLGSGEKPVFGDRGGSGQRRHLGDDFYSDIFQSSESTCSSPRRGDRDALLSSPGSRVHSPNRPTPIRWETLSGESSFPQFSLSEKMDKDLDHPAFGSQTQHTLYRNEDDRFDAFSCPLSPNTFSASLFTSQSVVGHGDLRNNGSSYYRQSPLSCQISSCFEGLPDTMEPAFQTVESQTGKSSGSLEDYISNRQFHFSMYKWAGKGVTLVMPSNSYEINESQGRLARLPEIIVQEVELPSNCNYFSPVTKAFESGTVTQEKASDKKEDDHVVTAAEGLSHSESGPVLLKYDTNKDKCGNQREKASVSGVDENSNTYCVNEKHNPEFRFTAHGEQNHELKSLIQLFDDDADKLRSHDISREVKEREVQAKSQKKQKLPRESRLFPGELNCTTLRDTLPFSEDKTRGNKVKGKVKEFIKKFNQEGSSKRKGAFEMLAGRPKAEEIRQDKVDELARVSSIGADESLGKIVNNNIPLFDISKENQVIEKGEEDKSGISSDGRFSEEMIEVLPPKSDPTSEVLNNAACHEENILEDFVEYLVQQLPANLTEAARNSRQQDQIKSLDAKIRQWSSGKEGNIRSLLSTLQLVLWPDSGWNPVPLVSIIEGPSVKKAYQKALLCLHPDKLQQKGASSSQKYIAEKVFDILQESWDHFNSVCEL